MNRAIRVCMDNYRRIRSNPRVFLVMILTALAIWSMMDEMIRTFSANVGIPSTPWVYPFLLDDWYIAMVIQFGIILLFCDAPFMNEGTAYLFHRSGRRSWFCGQVMYIIFTALLYQIFTVFISVALLVPYLQWHIGWGKILGTLAQREGILSYNIQVFYTPFQAMGRAFLLAWLVTSIYGMILFAANLILPRAWGAIIACLVVLFTIVANNAITEALYRFSPGSWMRLSVIAGMGSIHLPTISYIFCAGMLLFCALMSIAYLRFCRHPIETLPTL